MLKVFSIIAATLTTIGVVVWLAYQNLVPSGVFVARWEPGVPSALVGPLAPESRLGEREVAFDGMPYQTIHAEPVHFGVRMPQTFDSANVRVVFSGTPPLFEIGGLASRQSGIYELKPAASGILDALTSWKKAPDGSVTLYQRTPTFASVSDFLTQMPQSGVATYRATLGSSVKLPGYVASGITRTYETAFRGNTIIKTYLQNEALDFSFLVQDVNRHLGTDTFTIVANRQSAGASSLIGVGVEVAAVEVADDGNDTSNGTPTPAHWVRVHTTEPLSGVVRIDLMANDDIVFRALKTKQQKFVFMNRFYAADHIGYATVPTPFTLVSNGRRITATTSHPEAFQTLVIGPQELRVNDINHRFSVATAETVRRDGVIRIVSPYGDVRLETAGVFAFSRDTYFTPDPLPITAETDVDADGINYILTSYQPPSIRGEWKTAEAEFDLRGLDLTNRMPDFALSLPGIEEDENEFRIARIDVELRRPSIGYLELMPAIKRFWRSLFEKE